jgi:hypothetical protein
LLDVSLFDHHMAGSELVTSLRKKYGRDNVISSDIKAPVNPNEGPFLSMASCLDRLGLLADTVFLLQDVMNGDALGSRFA